MHARAIPDADPDADPDAVIVFRYSGHLGARPCEYTMLCYSVIKCDTLY